MLSPDFEFGLRNALRMQGASLRTIQNWDYVARAKKLLDSDPACGWLFQKAGGAPRLATLAALGRVEDEKLMRRVAAEVAKRRLSAREAGKLIRAVRFGVGAQDCYAVRIKNRVVRAVRQFLDQRPYASADSILEGLRGAAAELVAAA